MPELASDRRTELGDFLGRGEAVKARHQGILQGGRNRQLRQRAAQVVAGRRVFQHARLDHGLGQLFDKQRNAFGFADDLGQHGVR